MISWGWIPILLILVGEGAAADLPENWQAWERAVRDGRVSRQDGAKTLVAWEQRLLKKYNGAGFGGAVFFPLHGYGLKDIGGTSGEGFRPDGYDFLDGNRHRGHPAQDIFIHDRNRDCADDRSGKPVDVLALSDGVVLSVFGEWKNEGEVGKLRGGNTIWIYHPGPKRFSYYAHLRDICVGPGDRVGGGEKIATLGRTGASAQRAGSPTHLHLMILRVQGMKPVNPYGILEVKRWER